MLLLDAYYTDYYVRFKDYNKNQAQLLWKIENKSSDKIPLLNNISCFKCTYNFNKFNLKFYIVQNVLHVFLLNSNPKLQYQNFDL